MTDIETVRGDGTGGCVGVDTEAICGLQQAIVKKTDV